MGNSNMKSSTICDLKCLPRCQQFNTQIDAKFKLTSTIQLFLGFEIFVTCLTSRNPFFSNVWSVSNKGRLPDTHGQLNTFLKLVLVHYQKSEYIILAFSVNIIVCDKKSRKLKLWIREFYWFLVESHFSGCFCLFAQNLGNVVGSYKCYFVSLWVKLSSYYTYYW